MVESPHSPSLPVRSTTPVPRALALQTAREGDITDVISHIVFIEGLISRHISPGDRRTRLEVRLTAIRSRAADPKLYLGTIGEFSSGKSTFINGILRRRVLKASLRATTASITRIQPGPEFTVTVAFANGQRILATEENFAQLLQEIRAIVPSAAADGSLQGVLDVLTSDDEAAKHIRQIYITIPSDHLHESIVVIDTPGIGAGEDSAAAHQSVTEGAMEEMDAAIVLVPEGSPMSASLIQFLDTRARPFLHRCVFVLTAMDRLDESSRALTVKFVESQLRSKLHLKDPLILEASALSMIPLDSIPESIKEARDYWQSRFLALEETIYQAMMRQRILIISERLVRLLQDLLRDLNQELTEKRSKLAAERQVLEQNSVSAVIHVMEKLYSACAHEIQQKHRELQTIASSSRNKCEEEASAGAVTTIRQNGWSDNFKPAVRTQIEEAGRKYLRKVDKKFSEFRAACEGMAEEFGRQFRANYRAFPSLPVSISVPSISVSSIEVEVPSFSSSDDYLKDQDKQSNKGAGGGAAAGFATGLMVGGPVGALIGLVVGACAGAGMTGDNLEARQQKLAELAKSDISSYFRAFEQKVQARIDEASKDVLAQFRRAANLHVKEYGAAADRLIEAHYAQELKLSSEMRQTENDRAELARRTIQLRALQQRLSNS